MKYIIITLMFIILVFNANAGVIDKPIANISNCYNFTIKTDLNDGLSTPLTFKNCNKISENNYFCNCFNKENTDFQLIMQTDNTILREYRDYYFDLDLKVYSLRNATNTIRVKDWGDYTDVTGKDLKLLGDCYKYIDKPIYVNKTIYVNNTQYVDVIKEKILYVDRNVSVIEYQDKIIQTNYTEYITVTKEIKTIEGWQIIILIPLAIIGLIVVMLSLYNNIRGY